MLAFKSRDSGGIWTFGQKRTIVEDGSSWAVNPRTFQRGFVCFDDDNKVRRAALAGQPADARRHGTPRQGFQWQEQWAVNMKCINGADAGKEVVFKADHRRRQPGRRGTDRGGARPAQRRPARRQGRADRAS